MDSREHSELTPWQVRRAARNQALLQKFHVGDQVRRRYGSQVIGVIESIRAGQWEEARCRVCWQMEVQPNRLMGEMRRSIELRKLVKVGSQQETNNAA